MQADPWVAWEPGKYCQGIALPMGRIFTLIPLFELLHWHHEGSAVLQKDRKDKGSKGRHHSPQLSEKPQTGAALAAPLLLQAEEPLVKY